MGDGGGVIGLGEVAGVLAVVQDGVGIGLGGGVVEGEGPVVLVAEVLDAAEGMRSSLSSPSSAQASM